MPYATIADLDEECAGVNFSRLGDGGLLERIKQRELNRAILRVEDITQRFPGGFDNNEDASITIDGSGHATLRLSEWGYVPLLALSVLSIDDSAQTLTDFVWQPDGTIEFEWSGSETGTSAMGTINEFTPGTQNIGLTIDWGYATVPPAVEAATCLLAKARMLARVAAAQDKTEAAIPPGLTQFQMGEVSLRFDKDGQYAPQIRDCEKAAKELLNPFILETVVAPRGRRASRGSATSDAAVAHYRTDA